VAARHQQRAGACRNATAAPVSRSSSIMVPVSIALSAIRDVADRSSPYNSTARPTIRIADLQNAISAGRSRGPIMATAPRTCCRWPRRSPHAECDGLAVGESNRRSAMLWGLLAQCRETNRQREHQESQRHAEIKGNVTITARPKIAANWHRAEFGGAGHLGDTSLSVAGARVNVPAQVKPVIDKTVADQITALQARFRTIHLRAQRAAAMDKTLPLDSAADRKHHGVAAVAVAGDEAHRRTGGATAVDASAVLLTVGIEAETRITPAQTKPDWPVSHRHRAGGGQPGHVIIAVRSTCLYEIQDRPGAICRKSLSGGRFGLGRRHRERASVAPSGDRLLISCSSTPGEEKLPRLGGEANVLSGAARARPGSATVRLANIELAIESEAAFRTIGAAARAPCRTCKRRSPRRQRSI